MSPILFEIGPISIHAYGVFITAAFLAGMGWTAREARSRELAHESVPGIAFPVLLGSMVGARLLYVIIEPHQFIDNPLEIFAIWNGGLVFSGGFLLGALSGYWKLRTEDRRLSWLDSFAPGVALGQTIGRLGCFMAGCCYGSKTFLPWAVTFTDPNSLAPLFRHLHPTQLYHSLAGLLTFGILLVAKRKLATPGRVSGLFLILFATFRILIEFFRADHRGDLGIMSVTQFIALLLILPGFFLLFRKQARS